MVRQQIIGRHFGALIGGVGNGTMHARNTLCERVPLDFPFRTLVLIEVRSGCLDTAKGVCTTMPFTVFSRFL